MDEERTYQTLSRKTIPSVASIYQTGGDRARSGFVFDAGPDGERLTERLTLGERPDPPRRWHGRRPRRGSREDRDGDGWIPAR